MASNEIPAPGWNAIDRALGPLYQNQTPKHYGTILSYNLGGADPLTGISAYKRMEPIPHWHFITYGFSELYEKTSGNAQVSGWGFELTFRLKSDPGSEEPPIWALDFLQNLARYVFKSGNVFRCGDYMNANGPIALGVDTQIRAVVFVLDPELPPVTTPNGHVEFLQVVGITLDEELAIKQWAALKALAVIQQHLALFITDLSRSSLLTSPEIKRQFTAGALADGSNTSTVFVDQLSWVEEQRILRPPLVRIALGARQVSEVLALVPFRVPYHRPLELFGQHQRVVLSPSDQNGYHPEGNTLHLALSPEAARQLGEHLVAKEGDYALRSFPDLRIQVKRSCIKDDAGNVVETVG